MLGEIGKKGDRGLELDFERVGSGALIPTDEKSRGLAFVVALCPLDVVEHACILGAEVGVEDALV